MGAQRGPGSTIGWLARFLHPYTVAAHLV